MAARRTLCVLGVLVVFLTSAQPARSGEWITPGRSADGSLRPSNVVRAMRQYFETAQPNLYYEPWPQHPKPGQFVEPRVK